MYLFMQGQRLSHERFFPEPVARAIEKYRVTRFFGVPTMYASLLNNDSSRKCCMTSLKACRTNAAPPCRRQAGIRSLIGRKCLWRLRTYPDQPSYTCKSPAKTESRFHRNSTSRHGLNKSGFQRIWRKISGKTARAKCSSAARR